MSTKSLIGVLGIFLVGTALGVVVNAVSPVSLTGMFADSMDVSPQVESLYELVNPGTDASVVNIEETSGLYKILFKIVDVAGGVTYREAYVTRDGMLMTENMIVVDQSISQLNSIQGFVDCLADKNVLIAGLANDTGTLLQFNVLGGSYATKLYLSCDGDLAQQCVDVGITQVPSTIYNNQGYPGVQPIGFFENLTACKF